jgi:hypothetical protein
MSETLSGDEELETASVEPVSETPSEDDAARDDDRGALQLSARLDALEACTVELLRCFDESKRNMDRYYHAFLELETVVNQLAENQNRLTEFVQSVPGGAPAGGAPAGGAPAAGGAGGAARNAQWRGKACPHGRRPYSCRHCAAGAAPRGAPSSGAEAHTQLAGDLRSLKARIAQITRPGARPAP